MTKRKLQEISRSETPAHRSKSGQHREQQRFLGYFENGQRQLVSGLKIARGIERQKLGRRQKDARIKIGEFDEGKVAERINAEIQALKALDLNLTAEFYIARTLCRIKTIADTSIIPENIRKLGQGQSPYQTQAATNVTARLFKSTIVKNCMDTIEDQIRDLIEDGKKKNQQLHSQHTAHDEPALKETSLERHALSEFSHNRSPYLRTQEYDDEERMGMPSDSLNLDDNDLYDEYDSYSS